MSLSVYCLRNGLSIKYVRNWQEGSGGHKKCYIGYQDVLPQIGKDNLRDPFINAKKINVTFYKPFS